jgi:hypothetical protein
VYKPTIEKMREELQDPTLQEEFEYVSRLMAEMDRKRGVAPTRENGCVESWKTKPS